MAGLLIEERAVTVSFGITEEIVYEILDTILHKVQELREE
jgi:hypothetical protein